ncbi:MAG: MazG nucleotide pyrophosphohydrolase domain-containing protein [Anaerolineaceae bacterium]
MAYPSTCRLLNQAQEIQSRAARVGFDWAEIKPVFDKVFEEIEEVQTAKNADECEKEIGDLLFAVVNLARWFKVDAESALRLTNLKFRKRFAYIEKIAREKGTRLADMSLAEMDVLWEEAKGFD